MKALLKKMSCTRKSISCHVQENPFQSVCNIAKEYDADVRLKAGRFDMTFLSCRHNVGSEYSKGEFKLGYSADLDSPSVVQTKSKLHLFNRMEALCKTIKYSQASAEITKAKHQKF